MDTQVRLCRADKNIFTNDLNELFECPEVQILFLPDIITS